MKKYMKKVKPQLRKDTKSTFKVLPQMNKADVGC